MKDPKAMLVDGLPKGAGFTVRSKVPGNFGRVLVLQHADSNRPVSAYNSRQFAMTVLNLGPGEVEVAPYAPPDDVWRPDSVYFLRWVGKIGGGADELRLEYRCMGAPRKAGWERVG